MGERETGRKIEEELESKKREQPVIELTEKDIDVEATEATKTTRKKRWEKERGRLADSLTELHAERKANAPENKDELSDAEMAAVRELIAQAVKEDEKINIAITKARLEQLDSGNPDPYGSALSAVAESMLEPGTELYRQAATLLNSQPDGKAALEALMRKIPERVTKAAKAMAQRKSQLAADAQPRASRSHGTAPAETGGGPTPEERRSAAQEALKPFSDDERQIIEGDRRRMERKASIARDAAKAANEDKESEDARPWWKKLFDGKKAA